MCSSHHGFVVFIPKLLYNTMYISLIYAHSCLFIGTALGYDRYKFAVQVLVGERRDQGVK